jgi:hypothetical protein
LRGLATIVSVCLGLAGVSGCEPTESKSKDAPPAAPAASAPLRAPTQAPIANELIDIPGGAFLAGELPGQPGREPEIEPRRFEIELGPFQIDRLPYPNDPIKPALTGVTRDEARKLCAARDARLCTELEWERACKGPASDRYLSGAEWAPLCSAEPAKCASGFDVLAIGAALREWVASDVVFADRSKPRQAVLRGAPAGAPAQEHRCARRRGIDAGARADDIGFRCCKGAPNAATVPEPELLPAFEKASLSAADLEKLLSKNPVTQVLAKDVKYFREPEAARTVVSRGPGDTKGFEFTVLPLLWRPVAGAEYLVVSARSGERSSFVLAFYVVGKDEYELAASFRMQNEPGPVALAYSQSIRPRLHFSTCWGCPGESGRLLYRPPDSVSIVQP